MDSGWNMVFILRGLFQKLWVSEILVVFYLHLSEKKVDINRITKTLDVQLVALNSQLDYFFLAYSFLVLFFSPLLPDFFVSTGVFSQCQCSCSFFPISPKFKFYISLSVYENFISKESVSLL